MDKDPYEEWLGEGMAIEIREAKLKPSEPSANISHQCDFRVYLSYVDHDEDQRERVIQHYLKYFGELYDKLEVQAEMSLGLKYLDVPSGSDESMLNVMRNVLNKIMGGHPEYTGYMNGHPDMAPEEMDKSVAVRLVLAVTLPRGEPDDEFYLAPEYIWLIFTEAWECSPDTPGMVRFIRSIESYMG